MTSSRRDKPAGKALVPLPAIIADIGGTNARFAFVGRDGRAESLVRILVADHRTLGDALRTLVIPQAPEPPRAAVLAMAGAARGERVALTNGSWVAEPRRLIAQTGLAEIVILNDFEALALSLPFLAGKDLAKIGTGKQEPLGTRLVIGPGTGLGAAGLVHADGRWAPVRGEGGHIDFGPRTERDFMLWRHLDAPGGRVSAESLLSGAGLLRLHGAIAANRGARQRYDSPAALTAAATAGSDALAAETVELFATYLGRYAGDLALIFMPSGGVFIGGGIAPVIAARLRSGGFRDAFVNKPPREAILRTFATAIIMHPAAALAGLRALIVRPEDYAVDLEGRWWR